MLPVNSIFSIIIGVFIPPEGVSAIVVPSLICTGRTLFLSSIVCLITIPVETLVRAGTYALIALNIELSKYPINLK